MLCYCLVLRLGALFFGGASFLSFPRYPPADGAAFARKYLEGCYTYYTAPEESEASVAARMDAQDEALTPMEVLLMLFPDVEPALLEAAFQEANGHLEQTVELLLTAMFFSSLDTNAASMEGFQVCSGIRVLGIVARKLGPYSQKLRKPYQGRGVGLTKTGLKNSR